MEKKDEDPQEKIWDKVVSLPTWAKVVGVIGLVGVSIFAGVAIVRVARLSVNELKKQALERNKRAVSAKINEYRETGNVNYVNVGLYDETGTELETIEFEAETVDSDIKEGAVISLVS